MYDSHKNYYVRCWSYSNTIVSERRAIILLNHKTLTNTNFHKNSHICILLMFIHIDEYVLFPFFCQITLWSSINPAYVWSAGGHSWTSCLTIPESISQRYYRDLSCCQIFPIPSYQWKE